jgi:hypothetical protein
MNLSKVTPLVENHDQTTFPAHVSRPYKRPQVSTHARRHRIRRRQSVSVYRPPVSPVSTTRVRNHSTQTIRRVPKRTQKQRTELVVRQSHKTHSRTEEESDTFHEQVQRRVVYTLSQTLHTIRSTVQVIQSNCTDY